MELEFSQQIFGQSSNIKFHENTSNRSQVVHANGHTDGWMDRQDEPIFSLCNFLNAPKNCAMLMKHSDKLLVSKKMSFTAYKNMQLAYNKEVYVMTSEIIMAVTMKVTAFWNVMPYTWKK